MSIQAMAWAIRQQVVKSRSARHVLLLLANCANEDGQHAFPSVARMARESGLSERAVQSALRELEAIGVIRKGEQRAASLHIKRQDKRPIVYDIVMIEAPARGENAAPREPERGEEAAPRDAAGCKSRPSGVKKSTERGEVSAPDPSLEPSENPSIAGVRESCGGVVALPEAMRALSREIGVSTSASWIEPLLVVSLDPPILAAPTKFFAEHVRQHYAERLEELLGRGKIEIRVSQAHGVRGASGQRAGKAAR